MKSIFRIIGCLFCLQVAFLLVSCEEEYIPQDVFDGPQLVVEGYVEYGDSAMPPYLMLTRSSPFLSKLSLAELNNLFVHGADVRVSDGNVEVQLTEICLSTIYAIDSSLAQQLAQAIGFGDANINGLNFCVYVDVAGFFGNSPLVVREGGTYYLTVIAEGDTLRSYTTIPSIIPLDTVFYVNHPDFPANDSLVEIRAKANDPAHQANYYRIFTKRNNEPMYALFSGSVTDDKIFNGQRFEFPVQRAQPITSEFDFTTFGYFWRGDTVVMRNGTIDYAHFRFWQTMEYNTGSSGPFSSYVRVASNIEGGLGIWGGLSFKDYKVIIPPQ